MYLVACVDRRTDVTLATSRWCLSTGLCGQVCPTGPPRRCAYVFILPSSSYRTFQRANALVYRLGNSLLTLRFSCIILYFRRGHLEERTGTSARWSYCGAIFFDVHFAVETPVLQSLSPRNARRPIIAHICIISRVHITSIRCPFFLEKSAGAFRRNWFHWP